MAQEIPFNEWWQKAVTQLTALGLELPEEEIGDLEHMAGTSVEDFVAEVKKGNGL